MEEAEYCDRLALMNRGKLIALDTPAKLREGFDQRLLEVRTGAGAQAAELLQDTPGVLGAGLFGRAVHVTLAPGTDREEVARRLAEQGIEVDSIEEISPSLEDVFIARIEEAGGAPVDG
jgi:ABC-2 type transport system ATP-binding protein